MDVPILPVTIVYSRGLFNRVLLYIGRTINPHQEGVEPSIIPIMKSIYQIKNQNVYI